jgi:8-oxo-dGTP diphosphatase
MSKSDPTNDAPLFPEAISPVPEIKKAQKSVTVICACITRHGGQEILLSMRRAPGVSGLDGKWELPGGKVEFKETPEQTIVREIKEELGLRVTPLRLLPYLHTNVWEYEHATQHVVLACYECETDDELSEAGNDAKWVSPHAIDFTSTLPGTKEFVSLAMHTPWFNEVCIQFDFADSECAGKRFTVASQPTLFSRYGLVKYWGRIGHSPTRKIEHFETAKQLEEQIFQITKRRLADGYRITVLQGPEQPSEMVSRIAQLAKMDEQYRSVSNPIC